MKALLVELNGRRLCLAGIADESTLFATAMYLSREGSELLSLNVHGVREVDKDTAIWPIDERPRPVNVGDEVKITVVDVEKVDTPNWPSLSPTPRSRDYQ